MLHQVVAIEHRVDRADGRQVRAGELPPELLANLRGAPARILALERTIVASIGAGNRFACRCARWLRSLKACTPQSL
jgi:hypothetical protein